MESCDSQSLVRRRDLDPLTPGGGFKACFIATGVWIVIGIFKEQGVASFRCHILLLLLPVGLDGI